MYRKFVLLILSLLLVPALSGAASATHVRKHTSRHWQGYGFLPGYGPYEAYKAYKGRKVRVPRDILARKYPLPRDYGYYGPYQEYVRYGWYWVPSRTVWGFGEPGFYRGRYNGGSFGPCYTQPPIGPIWNCGR